ncbi:MAG: DNA polymerase III subunit beta [Coriobacteriaceae bacterium]|nr:DNA polymerase III subunit beta [Coriobacteriaceae bacterium]
MRISLARGDFAEALSVVGRALSNRSTLPILSGVLIEAAGETVVLQATDLEVSVRTSVGAKVEQPGKAVVPGRLLADIVRSLPEGAVTLEADAEGGSVTSGTAVFRLRALNPEDFPKFPEVEPERTVSLPAGVLAAVTKQVSKAASRDETRPILTGVLVVVEGGTLKMVATDSYRLAVREVHIEQKPDEPLEVVVPGRAIEEVPRIAGGAEEISMGLAGNQVVFEAGPTTFVTRKIEGSFPNYRQLIQQDIATTVKTTKAELLDAAKRVSLMAQHNAPLRVKVASADQTLTLSAATHDVGEAREDLMVGVQGDDVEVAFNHAFLIDGVASVDSEEITLEFVSPLKPGIIRSAEEEAFLYLLMPVRLG